MRGFASPCRARSGALATAVAMHLLMGAALAAAMLTSGCASYYYGDGGVGRADPIAANQKAVDQLLAKAPLDLWQPVLVATLVHLDHLDQSSRLGRLFSEQLSGATAQRGIQVRELKLRDTIVMKQGEGEMLLSREVRELSQRQDVQAVLVGTYAPAITTVFVSLKLVSPATGVVLAAVDYSVPLDANMRSLLQR